MTDAEVNATTKDVADIDWKEAVQSACANLPEHVERPYALIPEGERFAAFKRICPPEFMHRIDRTLLPNPEAFDAIASWSGACLGLSASASPARARPAPPGGGGAKV